MKPIFARPHLFIIYSRKDQPLAEHLYQSLTSAGFTVYFDREKTLIGENFVAQIVKELRRSDAVVAIISAHSAASPWCQAELYHAHALNKMIAPVHVGTAAITQAPPLDLMLKDINYTLVTDEASYPNASRQVDQRLKGIRRKAVLRSIRNGALLLLTAAFLVFVWKFGIQGLNTVAKARDRQALLDRLRGSTAVLAGDVLATYSREFAEDEETISQLLLMQSNPELPDVARLNAHLLVTTLLAPRKQQNRWFIEDINWQNLRYEQAQLADVTFMKGTVSNVEFDRVAFSGVVWNAAPSQDAAGLMLSNLKFQFCQFNAGQFGGTGGINLDFINSSFRGTKVDVSGFADVHFYSHQSDPNSSVITNEITVFENSAIENCVSPPEPGVLEIVPEDSEVRFTKVMFNGVHFRGLIRPSWFKDCTFMNCVFPPSITEAALQAGGNTVQNCSFVKEECY